MCGGEGDGIAAVLRHGPQRSALSPRIAVDDDGFIYVTDVVNLRIQKYSP